MKNLSCVHLVLASLMVVLGGWHAYAIQAQTVVDADDDRIIDQDQGDNKLRGADAPEDIAVDLKSEGKTEVAVDRSDSDAQVVKAKRRHKGANGKQRKNGKNGGKKGKKWTPRDQEQVHGADAPEDVAVDTQQRSPFQEANQRLKGASRKFKGNGKKGKIRRNGTAGTGRFRRNGTVAENSKNGDQSVEKAVNGTNRTNAGTGRSATNDATATNGGNGTNGVPTKFKKMMIEIHYEVLCGYCQSLISTAVKQMFEDPALSELVHFKFVPFGNALVLPAANVSEGYRFWHPEVKDDDTIFVCQHGQEECFGNMIQTCAMNVLPDNKRVPFIVCMESSYDGLEKSSYECFEQLGVSNEHVNSVKDCVEGKQGTELMLANAEAAAKAGIEHVPWVVIAGEHVEEADMSSEPGKEAGFKLEICKRLPKGINACQNLPAVSAKVKSGARRSQPLAVMVAVTLSVVAMVFRGLP